MTQLLQTTVPEPELKKLRALARDGQNPMVPWHPSKAEVDAAAFKRRGEILAEIEKRLGTLIDGEEEKG